MLRPRAERDRIGKVEKPEDNFVIIDLPAAHDHDDHGYSIGPMHDPDDDGVHSLHVWLYLLKYFGSLNERFLKMTKITIK
jgi:hypothetical protein